MGPLEVNEVSPSLLATDENWIRSTTSMGNTIVVPFSRNSKSEADKWPNKVDYGQNNSADADDRQANVHENAEALRKFSAELNTFPIDDGSNFNYDVHWYACDSADDTVESPEHITYHFTTR